MKIKIYMWFNFFILFFVFNVFLVSFYLFIFIVRRVIQKDVFDRQVRGVDYWMSVLQKEWLRKVRMLLIIGVVQMVNIFKNYFYIFFLCRNM